MACSGRAGRQEDGQVVALAASFEVAKKVKMAVANMPPVVSAMVQEKKEKQEEATIEGLERCMLDLISAHTYVGALVRHTTVRALLAPIH